MKLPTYAHPATKFTKLYAWLYKIFWQPHQLKQNRHKLERYLEIGPGNEKFPDFETCNIVKTHNTDYVINAFDDLPFPDNSFDLVFASHVLEHAPWYLVPKILIEWRRILKPSGYIEIFVPNALKIAQALIDKEINNQDTYCKDNWWRFNRRRDPCVWFNGRMFSYGDGRGTPGHSNWHLGCFTPRYLTQAVAEAGFKSPELLERAPRGHDHDWINLGIRAQKG